MKTADINDALGVAMVASGLGWSESRSGNGTAKCQLATAFVAFLTFLKGRAGFPWSLLFRLTASRIRAWQRETRCP